MIRFRLPEFDVPAAPQVRHGHKIFLKSVKHEDQVILHSSRSRKRVQEILPDSD